MHTISFMAFKGGAGKTISIELMASVLISRGFRIGILDADENKSIVKWKGYAVSLGTWADDKLVVYEGWDEDRLEAAFTQAAGDDLAYLLVDTHGGGSDLNQLVVFNSDLIVIPTDLSTGELDIALETMEYILNIQQLMETEIPTGILLSRTPLSDEKLAVSERQGKRLIKDLPVFDNRIPFNRYYKDLPDNGPLHLYARHLHQNPATRFRSGSVRLALKQAEPAIDEILAGLSLEENA
jgi:cellulose biosynthesis protein BcsQ